ncbi:hypothetical protein J3459_022528 [Metarhizium acridum]|nr:hypothetical protein J3459_022528 [Metarhizium acridum]
MVAFYKSRAIYAHVSRVADKAWPSAVDGRNTWVWLSRGPYKAVNTSATSSKLGVFGTPNAHGKWQGCLCPVSFSRHQRLRGHFARFEQRLGLLSIAAANLNYSRPNQTSEQLGSADSTTTSHVTSPARAAAPVVKVAIFQ